MRGPGGKKEVATLAWPLAVGMLSYTMMGLVDTLLVVLAIVAMVGGW